MIKRLKLIHYFMILATAYSVAPAANATYQDSIILNFLIVQFNLINDTIDKVGFALDFYKKQLKGQMTQNSIKQKTEVLGGVVANQTKTLANEKLRMNFGVINTIQSGGKTLKVGSVASSGCFNKKLSEHKRKAHENRVSYFAQWDETKGNFNNPDTTHAEIKSVVTEAYQALIHEREHIGNPFMPPKDLSTTDAQNLSKIAHYLVNNNNSNVSQVGINPSRNTPRNDAKVKYDILSESITSVITDKISNSISTEFSDQLDLSARDVSMLDSGLLSSDVRVSANNLKTAKGAAAELLEYKYRQISLDVDRLRSLQNQEKLLTIMALDKLDQYHKKLIGGGS